MRLQTRIGRTLVGLAAGFGLAAGAVIGAAAPAEAYSPDPTVKKQEVSVSKGDVHLGDVIDGTWFMKDKGGKAVKLGLWHKGSYVGKVEFHPQNELLYVYDNANDHDSIYGVLNWWDPGIDKPHKLYFSAPSTSKKVDMAKYNFNIPEGYPVQVLLYDNESRTDYIDSGSGVA